MKKAVGVGVGVVLVMAEGYSRVWGFVIDWSSANAVSRPKQQSGRGSETGVAERFSESVFAVATLYRGSRPSLLGVVFERRERRAFIKQRDCSLAG